MRSGERLALAIVVGMFVLVGGAAGAATYAWRSSGTVVVSIHEDGPDGTDVSMHFPGLLLDAAIAFCPTPMRHDDRELRDAMGLLETMAGELATMPDAVLVDVRDGTSRVRIAKEDGRITIRVREPGEWVHVDVPVGSVRRLASKLRKSASGSGSV